MEQLSEEQWCCESDFLKLFSFQVKYGINSPKKRKNSPYPLWGKYAADFPEKPQKAVLLLPKNHAIKNEKVTDTKCVFTPFQSLFAYISCQIRLFHTWNEAYQSCYSVTHPRALSRKIYTNKALARLTVGGTRADVKSRFFAKLLTEALRVAWVSRNIHPKEISRLRADG